MKATVFGVGVNDADYVTRPSINRVVVICPFFRFWKDMLERCYSDRLQKIKPTYIGCSVCDEWLVFSNFKMWLENQDWQGMQLDKDIIKEGNKVYSPQSCALVDKATNVFVIGSDSRRGEWPIGVCWHKKRRKFQANCKNPFTKKLEHLGYFECPNKAHLAWKKRKHELACRMADLQKDARVSQALRTRYL
jgi:hypothetical protein